MTNTRVLEMKQYHTRFCGLVGLFRARGTEVSWFESCETVFTFLEFHFFSLIYLFFFCFMNDYIQLFTLTLPIISYRLLCVQNRYKNCYVIREEIGTAIDWLRRHTATFQPTKAMLYKI